MEDRRERFDGGDGDEVKKEDSEGPVDARFVAALSIQWEKLS